ncbi:MAG: S10 family peptidase [Bryobacteraceae bacterium]
MHTDEHGLQRRLACTGTIAVVLLGATLAAQTPFVTRHSGVFNGRRVDYTATVGETVVTDEKGKPAASFFSISYVREGDSGKDRRPVLFLYNGGPGSASVLLHLGAFGPRRVDLPADIAAPVAPPYRLIENSYTVLDCADLVFIDPPETGYSRLLPGTDRAPFYSAPGDAKFVAQFVRNWAKANGREASPKFMLGESYGTIRAVLVADELAKSGPETALDGVVLLGQAVNIVETVQRAGNIVGYAVNLPTLTAIAWYHQRIDRGGKPLDAWLEESYGFAIGEYLNALARGSDLPQAGRERIAARLAGLTGLSAGYYLENGLVISKERFRREILRDKGLIVGQYDARYTGPAGASGGPPADPSMKMYPAFTALIGKHLTETLGVKLQQEYRTRDPGARDWNYGAPSSPFSDYDWSSSVTRAMKAKPRFRLMVGTGVYDTTTTTGAARYFLARGGFPPERVISRVYEGGHMAYTNEAALKALTEDVRAFIKGE